MNLLASCIIKLLIVLSLINFKLCQTVFPSVPFAQWLPA
jgi:hypothetical protein